MENFEVYSVLYLWDNIQYNHIPAVTPAGIAGFLLIEQPNVHSLASSPLIYPRSPTTVSVPNSVPTIKNNVFATGITPYIYTWRCICPESVHRTSCHVKYAFHVLFLA